MLYRIAFIIKVVTKYVYPRIGCGIVWNGFRLFVEGSSQRSVEQTTVGAVLMHNGTLCDRTLYNDTFSIRKQYIVRKKKGMLQNYTVTKGYITKRNEDIME